MKLSTCPSCGASIAPGAERCTYCQQHIVAEPAVRRANSEGQTRGPGAVRHQSEPPPGSSPRPASGSSGLGFRRVPEPNEGAFTVLVPEGWLVEGGIMRANLMNQVVDAQSIEAKLDLTVKRNPAASVAIRWCPEIKYCDSRMGLAGMMGMFGAGTQRAGMISSPLLPAQDFLIQVVFPWAHPSASRTEVAGRRGGPLLVDKYRRGMAALGLPANFGYDGGEVTFVYEESGLHFTEKAQVVIENMGPMAAGMWSNKDTVLLRAPSEEFGRWEPVLRTIQESVQINFQWLAYEAVNQEFLSRSFLNAQQAAQARERRMLEIQQQMQTLDRHISEHRMRTNAEIHNDAYLTLMELDEYVNPFTGEAETGSNQWDYRWTTDDGAVYYTDNEDDDPSAAGLMNYSDWRRTPVRPRFPQ